MDEGLRGRFRRSYVDEAADQVRRARQPDTLRPVSEIATPVEPYQPAQPALRPIPSTVSQPIQETTRNKRAIRTYRPSIAKNSRLALASLVVLGLTVGGLQIFKPQPNNPKSTSKTPVLAASTQNQAKVKAYLPANLPSGYSYDNNYKQIQTDVYYYSVSGPKGDKFHVTLQPMPANFDFNGFGAKFLKPDQYAVSVGSVVAGPVGNDLIASIRTTGNTWIIINSSNVKALSELETVTRSIR